MMIRKVPRKIPYNEIFGKYRSLMGKPIQEGEEAEVNEDE